MKKPAAKRISVVQAGGLDSKNWNNLIFFTCKYIFILLVFCKTVCFIYTEQCIQDNNSFVRTVKKIKNALRFFRPTFYKYFDVYIGYYKFMGCTSMFFNVYLLIFKFQLLTVSWYFFSKFLTSYKMGNRRRDCIKTHNSSKHNFTCYILCQCGFGYD